MKEAFYVEWVDAEQPQLPDIDHAWMNEDQIMSGMDPKTCVVRSCGFVVCKNESFIFLAVSVDNESDKSAAVMAIPKGCITRMVKLEIPYEQPEGS